MEQAQQLKLIGNILKTFGVKGELLVKVQDNIPDAILENKEPVFIHMDGLPVPFYMKHVEPKGNRLKVIFEDMETEALATELVGKPIYRASKDSKGGLAADFDMLIGFTAVDKEHGELGIVKEIMDIPGNPCLVVDGQDAEIIIPLNQDLIVKVDAKKQVIHLSIPDGLLELYT